MRKFLSLATLVLITLLSSAQPTVSPNGAAELCPEENITLVFDFGSFDPLNFTIKTDLTLKGVTIVQNIQANSRAIIKFSDKKETHSFAIWHSTTGSVYTYTYTKIKTLAGLKQTWPPGQQGIFRDDPYDDVLNNFPPISPCGTTTFTYTAPAMYYKDASGNQFGTFPMSFYEWVAPKGWKINGTLSDGTTPITTGSPAPEITPDPLPDGIKILELKCRAKNNCIFSTTALKPTDWYRVKINRPVLQLLTNGQHTLNIQCGDMAERTFTVENTHLYPCISAYEWQIGGTWLRQDGTLAPATITTTSPQLILKPQGGTVPGTITVKMYVNGLPNVNTLSMAVNFNPIPLVPFTVTGPSGICTPSGSATYTVNNLLPGSTVSWATNQYLSIPANSIGSSVTVTRIADNRSGILTANVQACGISHNPTTTIALGVPAVSGFYTWTNYPYGSPMSLISGGDINSVCYSFGNITMNTQMDIQGTSSVTWEMDYSSALNPLWGTDGKDLSITFRSNNHVIDFLLSASNSCGTTYKYYEFKSITCGNRMNTNVTPDNNVKRTLIAPNPASTNITITTKNHLVFKDDKQRQISNVKIYDLVGRLRLDKKFGNVSLASVSVSDLQNGLYFVEVYYGKEKEVMNIKVLK